MKTTYIKDFKSENTARNWMATKNRMSADGTVYCLVDGPEDNHSVVDLNTAIELGCPYEWSTR